MTEKQLTQYLLASITAAIRNDGTTPADVMFEAEDFFKGDLPKTRKENVKVAKFDMRVELTKMGADDSLIDEWYAIRRLKKNANTKSALKLLSDEAHKAGISIADAIRFSVSHNWAGFRADWYLKEHPIQERKETKPKWQ